MSAVTEAVAAADAAVLRAMRRRELVQLARVEADAADLFEFTKLAALLRALAHALEESK